MTNEIIPDHAYPAPTLNITGTVDLRNLVHAFNGDGSMRYDGTPDGIRHDNARRAGFAAVAVVAYGERTGVIEEDLYTAISDLLGDLRHLADATGLDFDTLSNHGLDHYAPELRGAL